MSANLESLKEVFPEDTYDIGTRQCIHAIQSCACMALCNHETLYRFEVQIQGTAKRWRWKICSTNARESFMQLLSPMKHFVQLQGMSWHFSSTVGFILIIQGDSSATVTMDTDVGFVKKRFLSHLFTHMTHWEASRPLSVF